MVSILNVTQLWVFAACNPSAPMHRVPDYSVVKLDYIVGHNIESSKREGDDSAVGYRRQSLCVGTVKIHSAVLFAEERLATSGWCYTECRYSTKSLGWFARSGVTSYSKVLGLLR